MRSVQELVKGDFVKTTDGRMLKIESIWGVGENGRLAKPSEGGFGVKTEKGDVSMWEASSYFKAEDLE